MKRGRSMSEHKIITREINGATYAYEIKEYYRNKDGKPRNRQDYLGKVDEDGVLITKKRKLPAQIKMIRKTTTKFIFEDIKN